MSTTYSHTHIHTNEYTNSLAHIHSLLGFGFCDLILWYAASQKKKLNLTFILHIHKCIPIEISMRICRFVTGVCPQIVWHAWNIRCNEIWCDLRLSMIVYFFVYCPLGFLYVWFLCVVSKGVTFMCYFFN